jgi:hypothetical protein
VNTHNKLVAYRSAGGLGSIYRWNFFMFDGDDEFYCVYASGTGGIRGEARARVCLLNPGWMKDNEVSLIDLTDKDALVKFSETFAGAVVQQVFQFLDENDFTEYTITFRCDLCKLICEEDNPGSHGPRSQGICATNQDLHCEDCNLSHTCEKCDDFWEDNSAFKDGLCEFCIPKEVKT